MVLPHPVGLCVGFLAIVLTDSADAGWRNSDHAVAFRQPAFNASLALATSSLRSCDDSTSCGQHLRTTLRAGHAVAERLQQMAGTAVEADMTENSTARMRRKQRVKAGGSPHASDLTGEWTQVLEPQLVEGGASSMPVFSTGLWVSDSGACLFTNAMVDPYRTIMVVTKDRIDAARQLAVSCFSIRSADLRRPYDPGGQWSQTLLPSHHALRRFCRCFSAFRVPVFTTDQSIFKDPKRSVDYTVLAPTLGTERWSQPPHVFHESIQLSSLSSLLYRDFPTFGHISFFKSHRLREWQQEYTSLWFRPTFNASFPQDLDFRATALFPGNDDFRKDAINNVEPSDGGRLRYFHSAIAYHSNYDTLGLDKLHASIFHRRAVDFFFPGEHNRDRQCPPRRAIVLQRSTGHKLRRFTNMDEVKAVIKEVTGHEPVVTTTNEHMSIREQALRFRSAGLVVSTHSSQLFGLTWMHPGASAIEVLPVILNPHFALAAETLGVNYRFAYGGSDMMGCVRQRKRHLHGRLKAASAEAMACGGTLKCSAHYRSRLKEECETSACRQSIKVAGKDLVVCESFRVNITSLAIALKGAVLAMDRSCLLSPQRTPWRTFEALARSQPIV